MILEGTYLSGGLMWMRIGFGTPWTKDWDLEFSDDIAKDIFLSGAVVGARLVVVGEPVDGKDSYVQHFKVAAWQWL